MVKPFSPAELVARVRAALRRLDDPHRAATWEPYVCGDLTIDYAERSVALAGKPVHLTALEYSLLLQLSIDSGRVLTHDQLLRRVWRPGKPGEIRSLRTLMKRLREKLSDDAVNPTYIFSEPHVGYRMAKTEVQGS